MRTLTVILSYYINPGMLNAQYDSFSDLPAELKENLRLIVVDDGSPNNPARPRDIGLPLEIYRMRKDVRWNQDACRNIGADVAQSKWLLFTDIDHLIPRETLEHLVHDKFNKAAAYRFSRVSAPDMQPYKPHPNSWFMTRKLFDRVGGYDERFAGFYGTDGDFADRVSRVAQIIKLDQVLVRVPREVIPDASTTIYTRKEQYDGENIRRIKSERARDRELRIRRLTFECDKVF